MIYYYEVVPADNKYRGNSLLTYSHVSKLAAGQIVEIKIREKNTLGFIKTEVLKPQFKVKPLEGVIFELQHTKASLSFFDTMDKYYPGYVGALGQLITPSYLKNYKGLLKDFETFNPANIDLPPLTNEQEKIYKNIIENQDKTKTYIIHGETGSGKTRLYLELAKSMINAGKSVLVLTPEISLTAPLSKQFVNVFGNIVNISHSNLTDKQRLSIWIKAQKTGGAQIFIGPRSTLFLPIGDIGMVVIDEFHDQSYKQDTAPYYSANRAASMLSAQHGAICVMGSATPPVADYYIAGQKNVPIYRMLRQAVTSKPAKSDYKIIDLTDRNERSNYPLITNTLIEAIASQLKRSKQSMVFINKRGTARSIVCQNCGWRANCVNCELPLTYHEDLYKVSCHICGYERAPASSCPDCKSTDVIFKNPGTKMIAQNLSKIFPQAKIMRFDKDNKKSERMENNYQSLSSGEIDIIVGTQMITKGHDLPKLGLVAFLQAEAGLDFPDFTSEERSYQLIKQLLGRVNRGHTSGSVILQTFDPRSPVIKYAAQGNWEEFYETQIIQRRRHLFPPFCHALKIEASRKSSKAAQTSLTNLVAKLKDQNNKLQMLGPSPNFIEKKSGKYSWQIIIKSKNRSELANLVKNLKGDYKSNLDPLNFL